MTDLELEEFYTKRAMFSRTKLSEISSSFEKLSEFTKYPKIVVYATGSYARLEAGEHSDLDVFFVNIGEYSDIELPRTRELRLFGKVLEEAERMQLRPFSNDSRYLELLHTKDILENLGSPTDDHSNYFTARMLLLLESYCLFGKDSYVELATIIIDSYFTDFDDHKGTFHPRFLMNDICRYWKTMLLNYESNRRAARLALEAESDTTKSSLIKKKQRVKNYKLKYSRMITCFATLAALGSCKTPVQPTTVLELVQKTPRERLEYVALNMPEVKSSVDDVLRAYVPFLQMTELSTEELQGALIDDTQGPKLNIEANNFGDLMFELLKRIDENEPKLKLIRNMVI